MKQWTVAVVAMVLWLSLGVCVQSEAVEGDATRPVAEAKRYPARQFNSKLTFWVWAVIDGGTHYLGATPSEKPLQIPACELWWVGPERLTAEVAAEIKSQAVPGLDLGSTQVTDEELADLKGLTGLQNLNLNFTKVSDQGLVQLNDLAGLQNLNLASTHVTDAGVAQIKGLTQLQSLNLSSTKVTDVGLAHLKGLTRLQTLDLYSTNVTNVGLADLKGLTRLQLLDLTLTEVTDAGLTHLKGLKELYAIFSTGRFTFKTIEHEVDRDELVRQVQYVTTKQLADMKNHNYLKVVLINHKRPDKQGTRDAKGPVEGY